MLDGLTSTMHDARTRARVPSPRATCSAMGSASSNVSRPRVQSRLQRFAVVERHRDEQLSVVGLADLVDRADVRMIERRRRARLRDESRLGGGVGAQMAASRNFRAT